MLAVLAMLAPKAALRVAPGGSAPPIPSAARRVAAVLRAGTGKQAPQPNWKADLIQGAGVMSYFCACDISNGEKKCLFKRAATDGVLT